MADPSREDRLATRLQADVQRHVRPDLDLWPAIRAQLWAPPRRAAAPGGRLAHGARTWVPRALLVLGVWVTYHYLGVPPPVFSIEQTVAVIRPVPVLDRLAVAQAPTGDSPRVSNAGPEAIGPPPPQSITASVGITLHEIRLTDPPQVQLEITLRPLDPAPAPGAFRPLDPRGVDPPRAFLQAAQGGPAYPAAAHPVAGPRAATWLLRFPGAPLARNETWLCTIDSLAVRDPAGSSPARPLAGPWVFHFTLGNPP